MNEVKISFGIIVLNGEPFIKYNLRHLYPHAHEIIVVEGGSQFASELTTKDGHSTDGTLEALKEFKEQEDPENKLKIITKDGFWGEKDEQSQAYAQAATGNYLWQVDIDEFYLEKDIIQIKELLESNQSISQISFNTITFWGSPDYKVDGWYLRRGNSEYHRLFKWAEGYKYVTHRPPTVIDGDGKDLRGKDWIRGKSLEKNFGIQLYHYSLLFPKQVTDKSKYYDNRFLGEYTKWAENSFFKLINRFRVHNKYTEPSWLERFNGDEPKEALRMYEEMRKKSPEKLRTNSDVEILLNRIDYKIGIIVLKILFFPFVIKIRVLDKLAKLLK